MLTIIKALEEWRGHLIGLQTTPFTIYTDHRALEYFTTKRLLNQRQARWAEQLSEYHMQLTYHPGVHNVVADALTRKHEELKTQKAKSDTTHMMTLINPAIVINAVKVTTLEINY